MNSTLQENTLAMLHEHHDEDMDRNHPHSEVIQNEPCAPYFYYRDFSALPDPKPYIPVTAPGRIPSFPAKMFAILSRPELADIVSWMPHGRSWKVHKPREFEIKVIQLYFEHAKFSSFIRQANGWGFRRMLSKGPDHNSYYHELFLRGLPHLLKRMKRPAPNGKPVADAKTEPDFYLISEISPLPESKLMSDKQESNSMLSVPRSAALHVVEKKPVCTSTDCTVTASSAVAGSLAAHEATHPAVPSSKDCFSNEAVHPHVEDDFVSTHELHCIFSQELEQTLNLADPQDVSASSGTLPLNTTTTTTATHDNIINYMSFFQENSGGTHQHVVSAAACSSSLPSSSPSMQENDSHQWTLFQEHCDTHIQRGLSVNHHECIFVHQIDRNRVVSPEPSAESVEKSQRWLEEPYFVDFAVEEEIHEEPFEDPFANGLKPCDFF